MTLIPFYLPSMRRLCIIFLPLAILFSGALAHAQQEESQTFQFQNILRDVTGGAEEKASDQGEDIPAAEAASPQTVDVTPGPQTSSGVTQETIAPPVAPPPTTIIPMADPPPSFLDLPSVKLQTLDKATARTMTFEARVGSTIQFGPIFIKIRACRSPPPEEKKESAAFLQIWENDPKTDEPHWVFSGWMFASSPALSSMDHPIYDVWVVECLADIPASGPEPDAPKPD